MDASGNDALMRSIVVFVYLLGMGMLFGKIAARLGRNPILFGLLFFVPLANLAVMAVLAFGQDHEA